jgi:hypothetical protein
MPRQRRLRLHPVGTVDHVRGRRSATATGRMISEPALLARVGEVLQKLSAVDQAMADVLSATASGDVPDAGDVRQLAHGLVALGGALTSLGVELASDAGQR